MKRETLFKTFSNPPQLGTERLILRKMKVIDAKDMFEYAKLPEVTRYLTWRPHPDMEYTREYLEYLGTRYATGDFYDWALIYRATGKMIGTCGFTKINLANNNAEIGYVLNPAFWRQGLAAEAAHEIMRFGFRDLGLHRIEARCMAGNGASLRVMEKLGMRNEGTFREAYLVGGVYRTVTVCSILENEFKE